MNQFASTGQWAGIPTGALLAFAGLMAVNGFFVAVEFAVGLHAKSHRAVAG